MNLDLELVPELLVIQYGSINRRRLLQWEIINQGVRTKYMYMYLAFYVEKNADDLIQLSLIHEE